MKRSDNVRNTRWPSDADEKQLSLLVVSCFPEDAEQFCEMLGESPWNVLSATSLQQALALLEASPVEVVICERDLPDGCWRDLLCVPSRADRVPLLIVTSRLADEGLWVEVLNEGGFDVIPKPLCEGDVAWVLASASLEQQQQPLTSPASGGLPGQFPSSRAERRQEAMDPMTEKRTRSNPLDTVWPLARQWVVVIATLALYGSLYLVILIGG